MQAIVYHTYGPPQVLRAEQLDRPAASGGQLLVRVRAAALNPVDCEIRRGSLRLLSGWRFPKVPGSDFAGEVVEAGAGGPRYRPGERVYGMVPPLRGGSYAEYLAVEPGKLARMPAGLSFEAAASLPLAALTALQALRDLAHVKAGQRVFIHGGSGGVGTVAIQIAKYLDARVTTTCSYRNLELVHALGADEVIDYTTTDVTGIEGGYDCYFDVYGNMPYRRVKHLLQPRGVHVSTIIAPANFLTALWTRLRPGRQARVVVVRSRSKDLELIRQLVENEQLTPIVDRTFPLEAAADAQAYLETRRASGKVVLQI